MSWLIRKRIIHMSRQWYYLCLGNPDHNRNILGHLKGYKWLASHGSTGTLKEFPNWEEAVQTKKILESLPGRRTIFEIVPKE